MEDLPIIPKDIVLVNFPFSDLSSFKLRPALVIGKLSYNDYILCQITSKNHDNKGLLITNNDFVNNKLHIDSFVKPHKIFTANKDIINKKITTITNTKHKQVIDKIITILQNY